jgi:hypothetical protein
MSHSTTPGSWDGPWHRVHTEQFEAAFLPSAGEDLESVDNDERGAEPDEEAAHCLPAGASSCGVLA